MAQESLFIMEPNMVTDREIQIAIELIGRIKMMIIYAIPVWILSMKVKDWISLFFKRLTLKTSMIISTDGIYEVAGVKGKMVEFGWRRIQLQDNDGRIHFIPMELAVRSTITKLDHLNGFYKRRQDDHDNSKKRR